MAQEETQPQETAEEQKTFTQQEVDDIIKKRLSRAKSEVPADYEELKSKALKFDELQEANKTELQKAQDKNAKLEGQIKAYKHAQEVQGWKQEIEEATGIPAQVLRGNTREEIESHAQVLQTTFAKPTAPVIGESGRFSTPTSAPKTNAERFADVLNDKLSQKG